MKFDLVVADPCWTFSDQLTMDKTPRGAAANYALMSNDDIKNLEVHKIAETNSALALWVPGSLLQAGLDVMVNWGFRHVQTWIWVKTKKCPLGSVKKAVRSKSKKGLVASKDVCEILDKADLNETLAFGMGHLFRQCHELVLVGVRGKPYKLRKNKSQRSISLRPATKHSVKPEDLQDRLEKMFPDAKKKLEMFARRERQNWICVGNEMFLTQNEEISKSLEKIQYLSDPQLISKISSLDSNNMPSKRDQEILQKMWADLPSKQ